MENILEEIKGLKNAKEEDINTSHVKISIHHIASQFLHLNPIDSFLNLPFYVIQKIFQHFFDNYLEFNANEDINKTIDVVTQLLDKLLQTINLPHISFPQCMSIIGSIKTCLFCKTIQQLYLEDIEQPEVDWDFVMEEKNGQIEKLKKQIFDLEEFNPPEKPENLCSDMFIAAKKGDIQSIRYLIEVKKVNINNTDIDHKNMLIYATKNGDLHLVKYLVNRGIDIDKSDYEGETAIFYAVRNNHPDLFKYLLANNASIDTNKKTSIIHAIALSGNVEMMKIIMSRNPQYKNGAIAPIFYAAKSGNIEMLNLFLNQNNIQIEAPNGINLLFYACESGNLKMVKYLYEKGARVKKSYYSLTLMHTAAQTGNCDIIKYLMQIGLTVDCVTDSGATPLYYAAENGNVDATYLLCQNTKNVLEYINKATSTGSTPLYIASQCGHIEEVKCLLSLGAKQIPKIDMSTPLYIASKNGHLDVVKILVSNGCDINAKLINGITPLYIATFNNHLSIIKYLMKNGADPNATTVNGASPLSIASKKAKKKMNVY